MIETPYQHIDCNGCRANAHSEPEAGEHIYVRGNCGKQEKLGSCFGVIMYPVRNPTPQAHERMSNAVRAHNEKAAA